MAKSKAPKTDNTEAGPSFTERLLQRFAPGTPASRAMNAGIKVLGVTLAFALAIGLLVGRDPLVRRVGQSRAQPLSVRFDWPLVKQEGKTPATWVPAVVQDALIHLVVANVSMDPFDNTSLERGRNLLLATGWFESIDRLQRKPGGVIDVDAEWRVPVALVRKNGHDFLIGNDAAPIRIPDGFKPMKGLFVIENPLLDPPMEGGKVRYGVTWNGGDVQAALSLLRMLKDSDAQRQITGVDLAEYLSTDEPKLVIVTDHGTRIVWGAAIGELAPGQVPVERRLARLEQQLRGFGRIDANQDRLEIYTPVVMVDKTARRG